MRHLSAFAVFFAVLVSASAAHAERWVWFPISGGAVGVDQDSRSFEVASGIVGVNTVTYYDEPRSSTEGTYQFVLERLEFECRGNRYRWSRSGIYDAEGLIVAARADSGWTDMGPALGSAALYRRLMCTEDTPPPMKMAEDLPALLTQMKGENTQPLPLDSAPQAPPVAPSGFISTARDETTQTAPEPEPESQAADAESEEESLTEATPFDLDALTRSLLEND